jgi:hypothetical protein
LEEPEDMRWGGNRGRQQLEAMKNRREARQRRVALCRGVVDEDAEGAGMRVDLGGVRVRTGRDRNQEQQREQDRSHQSSLARTLPHDGVEGTHVTEGDWSVNLGSFDTQPYLTPRC